MPVAVKITEKGQITIPREVRNILKSNLISFIVMDGVVTIQPLRDVGGALYAYSQNAPPKGAFRKEKETAWEDAIREKFNA